MSDCIGSGSPPPALIASAVEAAVDIAAGATVAAAVPAKVAALTEGVLKAMVMSKFKTSATGLVVALSFIAVGGALVRYQTISACGAAPASDRRLSDIAAGLAEEAQNGDKKEQTIKPRDILVLTVTGRDGPSFKEQLAAERIVRPDGTVSLGMYGSTNVSKMTTEQAGIAIEQHLTRWHVTGVNGNGVTVRKVQVAIKGQTIDEVWRAIEDLEAAREKLKEANKIVDAARGKFLDARKRLGKLQPGEASGETGELVKVDAGERKLRVAVRHEAREPDSGILHMQQFHVYRAGDYKEFTVAKDATIIQDNVKTQLADLKSGSHVTLRFDKDGKTVVQLIADGDTIEADFVSANETRNTIEVNYENNDTPLRKKHERRVYHLVKETVVVTEGGKAIRVNDIPNNALLFLTRSVQDANTVIRIEVILPHRQVVPPDGKKNGKANPL